MAITYEYLGRTGGGVTKIALPDYRTGDPSFTIGVVNNPSGKTLRFVYSFTQASAVGSIVNSVPRITTNGNLAAYYNTFLGGAFAVTGTLAGPSVEFKHVRMSTSSSYDVAVTNPRLFYWEDM